MHKLKLKRAKTKSNHIYTPKTNARKKRRYQQLFADSDVLGFDYEARSPREAKEKFVPYFDFVFKNRKSATIVANDIGAFFAIHTLQGMEIKNAYFISPIINMQNLIEKMMSQAHVSEEELRDKSEPNAEFKEKFS